MAKRDKKSDIIDFQPRKYTKRDSYEEFFGEDEKEEVKSLFDHKAVFYDENTYIMPRNFESRLKQSPKELKEIYGNIKNALMSYREMHSTMLKMVEVFRANGVVAKMRIKGKSLYIYLKLLPATVAPSFLKVVDKSHRTGYEETPCEIKVTGKLKCKRTIQLIDLMMEAFSVEKRRNFIPVNYIEKFPYVDNGIIEGKNMILK